jgi:predicted Zn-dependent peptidase
MTLIVVGDLRSVGPDAEAAVRAAFERRGHGLADCAPAADTVPAPGGPPRLWHRPGPGGPDGPGGAGHPAGRRAQTRIMIGGFGIDRLDPRWPAARIAGDLLGAGPEAVLNRRLRGELGISYGFDVRFIPYHTGGIWFVAGSVHGGRGEQAVAVIREVLDSVAAGEISAEEFEAVRRRTASSGPLTYESALAVAHQYLEMASCGVDESFVDAHLAARTALDHERWTAEVRELVVPERTHVAVVGAFDPDASVLAGMPRG